MIKSIIKFLGISAMISFTGIAIYGSYNSHIRSIPVNLNTIPYERECEPPVMIELAPEPDYAKILEEIYYYNWTDREKDLLVRIAQSEAGNQGTIGMAMVMRVVINRVEKNGTDIETEIFKPTQFAVAGMAPGTWETYEALDMVQMGWDESEGALFFCADGYNGSEPLFRYKGHWFSK